MLPVDYRRIGTCIKCGRKVIEGNLKDLYKFKQDNIVYVA